jgi:RNA polymerase sigma-70 factor (ECF subfamily)
MVKDREEAKDTTQSVFMKAYQNLERLKCHSKFVNWLSRIARNQCLDWIKAKREEHLSLEDAEIDGQLLIPSVEEEILQQEFDFTIAKIFLIS